MINRRHLLQLAPAGFLGLSLPQLLRADTSQKRRRCKSIIYLHQYGGLSQFETFDMNFVQP